MDTEYVEGSYPEVAVKVALFPALDDGELKWTIAVEFADYSDRDQRWWSWSPFILEPLPRHPFFANGANMILTRDDWDNAHMHSVCEALVVADWH